MKQFLVFDKSGRSAKPYRLDITHLRETWDLDETDWDDEIALGEWLDDCEIGDRWETNECRIECHSIQIYNWITK